MTELVVHADKTENIGAFNNIEYMLQCLQEEKILDVDEVIRAKSLIQKDDLDHVSEIVAGIKNVKKFEILKIYAGAFGVNAFENFESQVLLQGQTISELAKLMPEAVARRYHVIPIGVSDDKTEISIAMCNPMDVEIVDSISYIMKKNVAWCITSREEIKRILDLMYT
jgi:hypothetical protein